MPELPEVEIIAQELRNKIIDEVFTGIDILWPRSFESDGDVNLNNNRIISISRKGKYILFHLSNGFLITHLRMTGQLIVKDSAPENFKHLRLIFNLSSGKYLLFYDLRKFGRMYLTAQPESVLKNIGIDALDKIFTFEYFTSLLKGKKIRVKSFLLDQRFVAGLGNIYIDESLFRAGIHPETSLADLSLEKIKYLYSAIKDVLMESITRMGTTISDYRTTGGGFGENQNFLRVYKRENEPCYQCDSPIVKVKINSRGTHFCPNCQEKIESSTKL